MYNIKQTMTKEKSELKTLVEMAIAFKAANEYDYCPSIDEEENVSTGFVPASNKHLTKDALRSYCGCSPSEIVDIIVNKLLGMDWDETKRA